MAKKHIVDYIKESGDLKYALPATRGFIGGVSHSIDIISSCLKRGKKILVAGNGGSAADAQHFAAELVGKYKVERRGFPVISLSTDTSIITAWGNDYSFEDIFARQIEALGKRGDIFVAISTSGNSKNLIQGAKSAKQSGMKVLGLLGRGGGELKNFCDIAIVVPSDNTPRIQEVHTLLVHIISEEVEKKLYMYKSKMI